MQKSAVQKSLLLFLSIAVFLSLFSMKTLFAIDASISGLVTDLSGKVLKNVEIILIDSSRGLKFSTRTDKNGKFYKRGIIASTYEISFNLKGYISVKDRMFLQAGLTREIEVRMKKIQVVAENDFAIGSKYFREGKYEEAINHYKKSVDDSPDFAMAHYNLGLSFLRNGNIDAALLSLKRTQELKPDLVLTYFALGECYIQKNMLDEAIDNFKTSISLDPKNPKIYFSIGVVYNKINKTDEAISAFEKARELDPDFSANRYQLGLVYLRKGNYDEAIVNFEKFLEIEPTAPEAEQVRAIITEIRKKEKEKI